MLSSCIIRTQTIAVSGPLTVALFLVFSLRQPTRLTGQAPLIGPSPSLPGELAPANPRAPSSLYDATEELCGFSTCDKLSFLSIYSFCPCKFPSCLLFLVLANKGPLRQVPGNGPNLVCLSRSSTLSSLPRNESYRCVGLGSNS